MSINILLGTIVVVLNSGVKADPQTICQFNGQTWLQGDMISNQLYKTNKIKVCSQTYCDADGTRNVKNIDCGCLLKGKFYGNGDIMAIKRKGKKCLAQKCNNGRKINTKCPSCKDCKHGTCNTPGECICDQFWSGENCDIPVCPSGCNNGKCTGPNTCTCDEDYEGMRCDLPVCRPRCIHGDCIAPDECECEEGWEGPACDQAVCTPDCGDHGDCTSPDECTCHKGWTGQTCDQPICMPACSNGECTAPGECTCDSGWEGPRCTTAKCSQGCVHGNCNSPDVCTCDEEWTGPACDQSATTSSSTLPWPSTSGIWYESTSPTWPNNGTSISSSNLWDWPSSSSTTTTSSSTTNPLFS